MKNKPSLAHFILTRFNLKRNAELPENWLERRIELFERYCLPSVAAQSREDFLWILLCEASTKDELSSHIEKWCNDYKNLSPRLTMAWCNKFKSEKMGECVQPIIEEHTKLLGASHILTSRLDNDDAYATHFIESLQRRALEIIKRKQLPKGGVVLDFPEGVRLHEKTGNLYLWNRPHNPFISLLRDVKDKYKTIYSFPGGHGTVWKYIKVQKVNKDPVWMQVLHDQNISNKLSGKEKPINKSVDWLSLYFPWREGRSYEEGRPKEESEIVFTAEGENDLAFNPEKEES